MKTWISHPAEPKRLLLAWQAPDGHTEDRLRWAVGVIDLELRQTFRYFDAAEIPFHNAGRGSVRLKDAGFVGYPAFPFEFGRCFDTDVLKTFMRRLPPPLRADFARYQEYFSIAPGSTISGPSLLALTEARLPGDGFSIIDPFDSETAECDAVFEIAGYRYEGSNHLLELGDELELRADPTNSHDPNAVAVYHGIKKIGFVNRLQASVVASWLSKRFVTCQVLRKNGRVEAPRAYAMISVRPRSTDLAA